MIINSCYIFVFTQTIHRSHFIRRMNCVHKEKLQTPILYAIADIILRFSTLAGEAITAYNLRAITQPNGVTGRSSTHGANISKARWILRSSKSLVKALCLLSLNETTVIKKYSIKSYKILSIRTHQNTCVNMDISIFHLSPDHCAQGP